MTDLLALAVTFVLLQAPNPPTPASIEAMAAEFPTEDASLGGLEFSGLNAKLVTRALAEAPDSPETLRLAAKAQRLDDVLTVLRRIVDRRPERIADALVALGDTAYNFRGDDEVMKRRRETLRQIVADVETQLPALPREDAARAARAVVNLQGELTPSSQGAFAARLARFIDAYRGTAAALEAEVDAIDAVERDSRDWRASLQRKLDALETFANAHPGTPAGAKALYEIGFQWSSANTLGILEPRGADPGNRFARVLAIAERLERGGFPDGEWVRKAPELVTGFFVSDRDPMSRGTAAHIIAELEKRARAGFPLRPTYPGQSVIGYVVTRRLPELYARYGDRVKDTERFLAGLETSVKDPSAVAYLRALFYASEARNGTPEAGAAFRPKMRAEYETLSKAGNDLYNRVALAALGSIDFTDGRYADARASFEKYLAAYPATPWAWVAAVRSGQSAEALGDPQAAAARYLTAAASDLPLAKVLGHEYVARVYESTGEIEKALAEHEQALALWDNDFGFGQQRYSTYVMRSRQPEDYFQPGNDTAEVARADLPPRIAALRRAAAIPGGAMLERGRTLLARERFDEAISVLTAVPAQYPKSPAAGDAQALARRARLQRVLAKADVNRPDADEDAALIELAALAREPLDFAVTAARIARASILWKRGDAAGAEGEMAAALNDWHAHQRLSAPATPVEADVAEIRRVIFLPQGGPIYQGGRWNAFDWAAQPPPFVLLNASVPVKLHDGDSLNVRLVQTLPGAGKALFFDTDEIALLERMIPTLGGTRRREPAHVMETPNQPVGDSMQILRLWNKFFPARPGHWGGWELETYPQVTEVAFTNAERTRAAAKVTIGYSGATVELEKEQGAWVARRLVNQWIT